MAETLTPSKFCGNPFRSFCVMLLTNQPTRKLDMGWNTTCWQVSPLSSAKYVPSAFHTAHANTDYTTAKQPQTYLDIWSYKWEFYTHIVVSPLHHAASLGGLRWFLWIHKLYGRSWFCAFPWMPKHVGTNVTITSALLCRCCQQRPGYES